MTNVVQLFGETTNEPTYKTEPAHRIRFFITGTDIEILTTEFQMTQFNCYDYDGDMSDTTEAEWAEIAASEVYENHLEGHEPGLQKYIDTLVDADILEVRAERIHTDMRRRPEWLANY